MQLRGWGIFTLVFLIALAASAVWIVFPHPDSLRVKWIVVVLILLGLCGFAGYLVNSRIDGILIDDRNRISLERFQWTAWLLVLLGGYFVESIANVANGGASFPELQPQLLALLGIVSASPVVSNLITDKKKTTPPSGGSQNLQPLAANDSPTQKGVMDVNWTVTDASWADLFLGEEAANRYVVDISRLQKLVITVLLVITYIGWLWHDLTVLKTFDHMPKVDENGTFVWLLGVSHLAYLAYKSTPKTPS